MDHPTCGGASSCALADDLLGLHGFTLLAVERHEISHEHPRGLVRLTIQTIRPELVACLGCGVPAADHGRGVHRLADAPVFGVPCELVWRKRRYRCREPRCVVGVWSEQHPALPARAALSSRAVSWVMGVLRWDDSTVAALARQLGVDWHTVMDAVTAHAATSLDGDAARSTRHAGVNSLGVDEHIWKLSATHSHRAATSIVDLTRDPDGRVRARLLDVTLGRSGPVYAGWLTAQPQAFRDGIATAALDPFRGYANAIDTELPDTIAVVDAFHIVRLGGGGMDEVRRRVQQDVLGRRGHKDDPLYRIRRLLTTGAKHLTDRGRARLEAALQTGDPNLEVTVAWHAYQQLRSMFTAPNPAAGEAIALKVLESFPTCPIPEIARIGRTLRAWQRQLLAYFDTGGASNGGTEAINLIIEKTRRLALGIRNFDNYRIRTMLTADGTRPWRPNPR